MNWYRSKWVTSILASFLLTSIATPYIASKPVNADTQAPQNPVELQAYDTEYANVFQNSDGTLTSNLYFAPVNYKDTHGNFQHIDTDLVADPSGGFNVDKNRFHTHFANKSDSSNLETVSFNGHEVQFALAPKSISDQLGTSMSSSLQSSGGKADHNHISFSDIMPDVSLQESVNSLGVKEVIVLNKYIPGLHTFSFVVSAKGVTPKIGSDGSVDFIDSKGNTEFEIPHGVMQDSNIDPRSGDAQSSNGITYSLHQVKGQTVLQVSIDETWLSSQDRVYPCYVDPSFVVQQQMTDAYVSSAYPTQNYSGTSGMLDSGVYDMHVGDYDSTTGDNWAYFHLPPTSQLPLLGLSVKSAYFNAYCNWSYYPSTPEPVWLWQNTSSNWSTSNVNWTNKPTHAATPIGSYSVARNQLAQWDITSLANQWFNLDNNKTNAQEQGLMLNENGNGQAYWHKFFALENSSNQPYIRITYNTPNSPWGAVYTHSDSLTGYVNLWWKPVAGANSYDVLIWNGKEYQSFNVGNVTHWTSKDKGLWPTDSDITQGLYQLHTDSKGAEFAIDPSKVYHNAFVAGGSKGTDYSSDKNYWFRVEAVTADGQTTDDSDAFTPTMQPYVNEVGAAPTMVPLFVGSANGATGNFELSATDLATSGFGTQVGITRTFNDNQRAVSGPFGNGWMLGYQTNIVVTNNLPHLIAPDGHETVFWPQPDGSYASPPGETSWTMTSTKDSSGAVTGYRLQTDSYTTEDFSPNGNNSYILTDIYDKNGNHFALSYTSGQLTGLTDASGRQSTISYNADGTIASIKDATGTSLWKYGYDTSKNLISVTDPNGNMTQYGYTDGDLTSVTTPTGNNYVISYNASHQVIGETNPAQKSESVTYGTGSVTFTDPLKTQTEWTYDNDHLTTQKAFDPTGLNRTSKYVYNEFGEVTQATDPKNNTTKYGYDDFGQLTSQTDPLGNTTQITRTGSSFNAVDHEVASVQTPQGGKYQFQYDSNHDQTTALTPDEQTSGTAYNANGTVSQGTYPIATANNPLENNSFEQSTNGVPTSWLTSGGSPTNIQSSDAIFGAHSWGVKGASGYVFMYPSNSLIPISDLPTDSKGIAFEVYAKATSQAAASTTRVQINYFNGSGSYIGQSTGTSLPVVGQWYKLTIVVPKSAFTAGAVSLRPVIATDPTSADEVDFDAADFVGYPLSPQYNAIVNGDFSDSSSSLHDWSAIGNISIVNNGSTGTGTNTAANATFGPYNNVAQIIPSSSWSGVKPSDSNQFIPYLSGQTYTVGAMVKGNNATKSYVALKFYDASKNTVLSEIDSPSFSGTFGWQYLTTTLAANASIPFGTAYIMPEVLVAPTGSTSDASSKTWTTEMRLSLDPNTSNYAYDSSGNNMTSVTDPLGFKSQYGYDSVGNVSSVIDPLGNTLGMTYDAGNRLKTQTSTPDNLQVQYTYDGDGNVTQVKQTTSDGQTVYATQSMIPNNLDQAQSSTDALGHTTSYLYDDNGRLSQVTLPDTHQIGVNYNTAGEPLGISVNSSTINQYQYDADGQVTTASNGNASSSYGYDANGNLKTQTDNTGSQAFTYDKNNALTSSSATIGATSVKANYNLNDNEQVSSITDGSGANLASYGYNEQGLFDTVSLGNGMTASYRYDGALHLQSLTIAHGATMLVNDSYSYDADGNLIKRTDNITGKALNYKYDSMNRLAQEDTPSGSTIQYSYDALGNITKKTVVGGSTTNYSYNAGNELTAVDGQAYTYNANGELSNDGKYNYKWNELGQLIEVDNTAGTPIAIYTYDAIGRRVSEQANGTTTKFFYVGSSNLVAYETDGNGNLLQSYTYGANGQPLTLTTWSGGTGTTYYYHENGHGDVLALTDSSGNTVAQYTYDAWGNILTSTGTMADANPYRYGGYRFDSAIWMYYLNARYYSPNTMRFISPDPVGGMNAYVYCDDNPVMKLDPSGEWSFWGTVALIGGGVVAVGVAATGVGLLAEIGGGAILEGAVAGEGIAAGEAAMSDSEAVGAGEADATAMDTVAATTEESAVAEETAAGDNLPRTTRGTGKGNQTEWPPNRGFQGTPTKNTLTPGTQIDRYGYSKGTFASPKGTPFGARALPSEYEGTMPYHIYEVMKPLEVNSGKAAPWFGQLGMGIQYELPRPVQELLDAGILQEVK